MNDDPVVETQEKEEDLCPICGGVLRIDWTITFREGHPHTMKVSSLERACFGHPPPEQRHTGRLDPEKELSVGLHCNPDGASVKISHFAFNGRKNIYLTPKQALSLLSWLLQEQQQLKELDRDRD